MDLFFNETNLKSFITLLHIIGLVLGLGGAWFIDGLILFNRRQVISSEYITIIDYLSKCVSFGIGLLWLSGALFITYYYVYTPDFLMNEKVFGKVFIVTVLSVNGYFVHTQVLPYFQKMKGCQFLDLFLMDESRRLILIGTVSFISWIFTLCIGVSKSLNFSTPALSIILFYLATLLISLILSDIIFRKVMRRGSLNLKDVTGD